MAKPASDPKKVTIKGRLSFPRFKHAEAVAFAAKSSFDKDKDPSEISSSFTLLLEQDQLDKLVAKIRDEYLPFAEAQHAAKEKYDSKLTPAAIKKILAWLEAGDLEDKPPFMPIKAIKEEYQDATPECVARLDLKGPKGGDISLKARVESEDQLAVPDPDLMVYPALKNLNETVFEMYPGAYVATTINLYSYLSSVANFGIGAGVSSAVYLGNLEGEDLRGGGAAVDVDEMFDPSF